MNNLNQVSELGKNLANLSAIVSSVIIIVTIIFAIYKKSKKKPFGKILVFGLVIAIAIILITVFYNYFSIIPLVYGQ
ncbi:hypothetical protein BH10PAT1_BH10PAT1_5480 [soil metagenome]